MKKQMENNNEREWVSVSEMAKRIGCTKQTIYNKIKSGVFDTKEFSRGKMKGILILT